MSERGTGTGNATLFGTVIMLMFVVASSRTEAIAAQLAAGRIPLELWYIVLLFILLFQAVFFFFDTGELVIDTSHWSPQKAPRQLFGGLVIGVAVGGPLGILGVLTGGARLPENFASEFVTQALYVTFVETVFLIVVVGTVRYRGVQIGLYVQPLLFAFMHVQVREAWLDGDFTTSSIAFFAYAGIFGVFFEALYLARTHPKYGAYFGSVTVWIVHLIVNTFLILVRVALGDGFELFPVDWWWSP